MKISRQKIKNIVKEELSKYMHEGPFYVEGERYKDLKDAVNAAKLAPYPGEVTRGTPDGTIMGNWAQGVWTPMG
tara:strand:- start:640 stop:861 length:222 start_codon:yes stop_codon:yes gene_type:complete